MSKIERDHIDGAIAGLRNGIASDVASGEMHPDEAGLAEALVTIARQVAIDQNRIADALERLAATFEEKNA